MRFFSPGRINLIGEHTDYNDGWVLPVATRIGNTFTVKRSRHRRIRVSSSLYANPIDIPLDAPDTLRPLRDWGDYFRGVLKIVHPGGEPPSGLDVDVASTLPTGSGLSSSASITVGFASVLDASWGLALTRRDIVSIARRAENEFVGLACGLLDPFAVAMGVAGHAILFDCERLEPEAIPFPADRYAIVAADTGVRRELTGSDYNRRRDECRKALARARRDVDIRSLSALASSDLDGLEALAEDAVLMRRARHVVSENERVLGAAAALRAGDVDAFGAGMVESHESLRRDYEVSCAELDIMVDEALAIDGVAGAKMTGGGFGGSVVCVVARSALDDFLAVLAARYCHRTQRDPRLLVCDPGRGAGRVDPD